MVAKGTCRRVAANDGGSRQLERVVERTVGSVAQVYHYAQSVHLLDDLPSQLADAAMRGIAACRVAQVVVAVVA